MPFSAALRWSDPIQHLRVGPLTGRAELIVTDTGVASAVALVDSVVVATPEPGGLAPGDAARLATADRDRILAQLCVDLYGPVVTSTLTCSDCSELFDLDFALPQVLDHCEPPPEHAVAEAWKLGDVVVRAPRGADELAALASARPDEDLLGAVTDGGADTADHRQAVAALLERLAPMVSTPVGATCPECDAHQSVTFDVQRYLLGRLVLDRRLVLADVHLIASTYRWSRAEILDLSRSERRSYAALIGDSTAAPARELVR